MIQYVVCIYVDGQSSLLSPAFYTPAYYEERAVGPGACAAVMFPLQVDGVEVTFTKAVGKLIDSVSCEVEGIILRLEKVVDYFNATIYRKFDEVLYILCDCMCSCN